MLLGDADAFASVHQRLRARAGRTDPSGFKVPGFLRGGDTTAPVDVGDPYEFLASVCDTISAVRRPPPVGRGLAPEDRIYLAFPRTFAALDGRIGTALTQLAFLPFLRDVLGATVFLCLPTGVVGRASRKGRRGSPFAVADPFDIDQSLADPLLPEVAPITQYRALVQACHLLGMRAGSVVPLASLAIDSPLFAAFPELGYWWAAKPGERAYGESVPPEMPTPAQPQTVTVPDRTAARFVEPPAPEEVRWQHHCGSRFHWAPCDRIATGVTLANAFPDVLAGDAGTYTWEDVAMIRYRPDRVPGPAGVRDGRPADPRLPAWALMPAVLGWRYRELGERVILVDVGPSVPTEVLARARVLAGGWSPDFSARLRAIRAGAGDRVDTDRLLADLRLAADRGPAVSDFTLVAEELWDFDAPDPAIDAVTGPLTYAVSAHAHHRETLVESLSFHLRKLVHRSADNPYLAGASSHDTVPPPAWATAMLYAVYAFLPGAVPLLYSGVEWGTTLVTNKEFGLTASPALRALRDGLDDRQLALFNDVPVDWSVRARQPADVAPPHLTIRTILASRDAFGDLENWTYEPYFPDPFRLPDCLGYVRTSPVDGRRLIALANWRDRPALVRWPYPAADTMLAVPPGAVPPLIPAGRVLTLPARSALVALADSERKDRATLPPNTAPGG